MNIIFGKSHLAECSAKTMNIRKYSYTVLNMSQILILLHGISLKTKRSLLDLSQTTHQNVLYENMDTLDIG